MMMMMMIWNARESPCYKKAIELYFTVVDIFAYQLLVLVISPLAGCV